MRKTIKMKPRRGGGKIESFKGGSGVDHDDGESPHAAPGSAHESSCSRLVSDTARRPGSASAPPGSAGLCSGCGNDSPKLLP